MNRVSIDAEVSLHGLIAALDRIASRIKPEELCQNDIASLRGIASRLEWIRSEKDEAR